MTEQEKLEMNMAAAKVLGMNTDHIDDFKSRRDRMRYAKAMQVNIFTNPSQCLEVVKKLGETGSGVRASASCTGFEFWFVDGYTPDFFDEASTYQYDTYEQAVGAACLELMK